MPELPDVTVYVERLRALVSGQELSAVRVASPFVVRTFDPPLEAVHGCVVRDVQRLGKRIVLGLEPDLFLVVHLMIAGRLRWRKPGASIRGRGALAGFDFADGTLLLTEVSKKKRASIHVVRGPDAVKGFDRGGAEPLELDVGGFAEVLKRERHTLKRTLTDPRLFSGIGNAFSDEILHAARLSPVRMSTALDDDEIARLHRATVAELTRWTEQLRAEVGDGFPEKVTAFREGMAVHGRYRKPCPVCASSVQRIIHGEHETNYCPTCQTGGKLLADRALSRLLKKDWPKTLDELEQRLGRKD